MILYLLELLKDRFDFKTFQLVLLFVFRSDTCFIHFEATQLYFVTHVVKYLYMYYMGLLHFLY